MHGASPDAKWLAPPRKSLRVWRRGLSDVCEPSLQPWFFCFDFAGPGTLKLWGAPVRRFRALPRARPYLCAPIQYPVGEPSSTFLPSGPCVDCLIFQDPPHGQALLKMKPTSQIQTHVLLKERLVRLLKRVAKDLEEPTARPTPDDVIELCSNHTLKDCMAPLPLHHLLL